MVDEMLRTTESTWITRSEMAIILVHILDFVILIFIAIPYLVLARVVRVFILVFAVFLLLLHHQLLQ
jgi:hypothetical protein